MAGRTAPELPNPLGGVRRAYQWRGHQVAYVHRAPATDASAAPPVVFVHAIHAAAWSAEWRHVFPSFADARAGYALDLLGFGASDHPPLHYDASLYIDLLRDFLRDVVRTPAVLIGSSLGATYAVAVAAAHPELARAVVAVGPAGVTRLTSPGGPLNDAVQGLFRSRVPGAALFRALVSRLSIRFFLRDIYASAAALTPETIDLAHRAASHPDARFAPAAFVGMRLNHDIRAALPALRCPLLVVWGTRASQTPYREAAAVRALVPSAPFVPLPGGDLPHEESPAPFIDAVERFLGVGTTPPHP